MQNNIRYLLWDLPIVDSSFRYQRLFHSHTFWSSNNMMSDLWVNRVHDPPPSLLAQIGCPCLDGHPPWRRLLDAPTGHQVLKLQGPPADEAEGRTHRSWAIHVRLPQHPQRVGVVEGDPALLAVQTHSQSGGQRSRVRVGQVAVAAAVGVHSSVALAVRLALTVAVPLWEQDLAHAYGEEAEGRGVLAVFCSTVMAAVWVTAEGGRWEEEMRLNKREAEWRMNMVIMYLKQNTERPEDVKYSTCNASVLSEKCLALYPLKIY